jgi:hypothetical protein
MSDIKAGDLVMVVKAQPCCGSPMGLGLFFTVSSVESFPNMCLCCAKTTVSVVVCPDPRGGYPIQRLIKIDPPALPESIERKKELTV